MTRSEVNAAKRRQARHSNKAQQPPRHSTRTPPLERARDDPERGLSAGDFVRSAANGFGDPQNAYVHSMAYFRGNIYAGTSRHSMALLKLFPPEEAPAMDPWPVKVPDSVQELDLRGQIWCWSRSSGSWQQVHISPLMTGRDGQDVPRDLGYRGMAVFQGRSDPEPALYVATISTVLRGTAARILRSPDGLTFGAVSEPGLGNPNVSTFRSMAVFDEHLFVHPAGEGTTFNTSRSTSILRTRDPVEGPWEAAAEPGFGDPGNSGVFELEVFGDHLYAGTFNHYEGYQVWKTPRTGSQPCRWTKVVERGAHRGHLNEIAMSMCVFNGALYVGSGVQNGGYDRNHQVGPAAGEIIRIYPDDSWDLVVGSPRSTPEGMKYPISGRGPGFDNTFAGYIWRMAVHEGWLYVSTFDWSVFLPYARRPSAIASSLMRQFGVDHIVRTGAGFEIWKTRDGHNWAPVTRNGFGNPYNYGARTLVSTPHGLFVGTANPFGPEVAARLAVDGVYVPNPAGGAEVWLGRRSDHLGATRTDGVLQTAVVAPGDGVAANPVTLAQTRVDGHSSTSTTPRILVTGATGLLGKSVLDLLLKRGERIRVLALPGTVPDLEAREVEVVVGSLADKSTLVEAVQDVTTVYHLAGVLPGTPQPQLMAVNVQGTHNLAEAFGLAERHGRIVYVSSAAVYGAAAARAAWPITEESPLSPRGAQGLAEYGLSKIAAEKTVARLASVHGLEFVVLRPTAAHGHDSINTKRIVEQVVRNPDALWSCSRYPLLQPVHVQDLADAVVTAGARDGISGQAFTIAGSENVSVRDVARMIRQLRGMDRREDYIPDPAHIWWKYVITYDLAKARSRLGYTPRFTLGDAIEAFLDKNPLEGLAESPSDAIANPVGDTWAAWRKPRADNRWWVQAARWR